VSIQSLYILSYLDSYIDKSNFPIFLYKYAAILLNSINSCFSLALASEIGSKFSYYSIDFRKES